MSSRWCAYLSGNVTSVGAEQLSWQCLILAQIDKLCQ